MTRCFDVAKSGCCDCACRDCFDVAIGDDDAGLALCLECQDAGCDDSGDCECCRDDAYGADDWTDGLSLEQPGEWRAGGGEPNDPND